MHRESGKLLLGNFLGTAPVAYLGAPDNIAQRLHMVVASGSEALVPRFGANRDPKVGEALFWGTTWSALALSLILFIPFFILVPDFLRLWISPEFARQSGVVGQVIAIYLVSQGAFAPVATYFRGTGKPWFVTLVILLALIVTVAASLVFIPAWGVEGAAYAYLAGSMAPFLGVIVGGLYAFGRSSVTAMMRVVGMPITAGAAAWILGTLLRGYFGELTWFTLCLLCALLFGLTASFIAGADWLLGGEDAPSRQLVARMAASRKLAVVFKLIPIKPAP
jgi:O-antigen/teichoic acid export membrane protein